jgi:peptidoglycan/LPS O-acetylase OafA/YrhL
MANSPHIAYRPDVDGLRAIAVLVVLLFHAFPNAFPAGFIGVDIFFVISGFLISGIIFDGLDTGSFSFVDFYSRRIRRIFPALATVFGVCLIFGWFGLLPHEFRSLGKHVVGGAGFISNIVLLRESGYFDVDAKLKPLLHLWSLGIEEQYYLVWPGLLFLCRGRQRATTLAIGSIGLASFALNLYFTRTNPSWGYYLPVTRFFELMIGSALAFMMRNRQGNPALSANLAAQFPNLKSLAGILALVVSFIFVNENQPFPGWWGLLVCAGAYLLIDAGPAAWFNRHILAWRPMVGIGLISYPLYLWHWPIISFAIIIARNPPVSLRIAALITSVVLAWLTYHFIELPIRRGRAALQRQRVTWGLAAAMIFVAFLGALARLEIVRPIAANDPRNIEIGKAGADQVFVDDQVIPGTVARTALFFGDSHMQQYWSRIEFLTRQPGERRTVELRTLGGCAPIPLIERDTHPPCLDFVNAAFARAAEPDVDIVVIAGSWKGFVDRGDYYRPGVKGARRLDVLAAENQWIYDGFSDAISRLRKLGKRVVVVTSSPRGYAFDPSRMVDRSRIIPRYKPSEQVPLAQLRAFLYPIDSRIRAAAQKGGAELLDPDQWVCDATICPVVDANGQPMYSDASHIRATVTRERAIGLDQFVLIDRGTNGG